jgi:hypothetical protein
MFESGELTSKDNVPSANAIAPHYTNNDNYNTKVHANRDYNENANVSMKMNNSDPY